MGARQSQEFGWIGTNEFARCVDTASGLAVRHVEKLHGDGPFGGNALAVRTASNEAAGHIVRQACEYFIPAYRTAMDAARVELATTRGPSDVLDVLDLAAQRTLDHGLFVALCAVLGAWVVECGEHVAGGAPAQRAMKAYCSLFEALPRGFESANLLYPELPRLGASARATAAMLLDSVGENCRMAPALRGAEQLAQFCSAIGEAHRRLQAEIVGSAPQVEAAWDRLRRMGLLGKYADRVAPGSVASPARTAEGAGADRARVVGRIGLRASRYEPYGRSGSGAPPADAGSRGEHYYRDQAALLRHLLLNSPEDPRIDAMLAEARRHELAAQERS